MRCALERNAQDYFLRVGAVKDKNVSASGSPGMVQKVLRLELS